MLIIISRQNGGLYLTFSNTGVFVLLMDFFASLTI